VPLVLAEVGLLVVRGVVDGGGRGADDSSLNNARNEKTGNSQQMKVDIDEASIDTALD